jgi:CubicO group peptidase (beta-lactamase class C family)
MKKKNRFQLVLLLMVLGIGLFATVLAGLFVFMSATATPIHPNPERVSVDTDRNPAGEWLAAQQAAHRIAQEALLEQNLPGVSVAVGVNGDLVWAEGLGWADIERQIPVRTDTQFWMGTASTALTAAAVGLLVEEQRLNLDVPIQTYVPEFPTKAWPITIRQLMGHLSGLPNDEGDEESTARVCNTALEGLPRFADYSLRFEPGTRFHYSSFGWVLVSAAVEAVAGEPLARFIRRRIVEPLAMDDTTSDYRTEPILDRVAHYHPQFAADTRYGPQGASDINYSCFPGAYSFLSTPTDLVRFAQAFRNGALLTQAMREMLQSPQQVAGGDETGYGLGWDWETVMFGGAETALLLQDGNVRGGKAMSLLTFPDRDLIVVVMSNTSFADTSAIAVQIAAAFRR